MATKKERGISQHQRRQQAELGHLPEPTVVTGTAQTVHTNPHTAAINCIAQMGRGPQYVMSGLEICSLL